MSIIMARLLRRSIRCNECNYSEPLSLIENGKFNNKMTLNRLITLSDLLVNIVLIDGYHDKSLGITKKKSKQLRESILRQKPYFRILRDTLSRGIPVYGVRNRGIIQVGGFYTQGPSVVDTMSVVDIVQLILDIAGFLPGIGAVPDVISMLMSLGRGNYFDAMCSMISVIPLAGSFIGTPVKYIKRLT